MLDVLGLNLQQLGLFMLAGIVLNLTPGPDVVYVVTHALRRGARAGMVGGLGITTGCLVHIGAAALGVSALLAASATAFTVLKWVGASYLLWMGVRMLLSTAEPPRTGEHADAQAPSQAAAQSLGSIFAGGFWTNVLNPKVALFFLAFVPQFIPATVHNKALAFVLLGGLFNLNSVVISAAYALLAAQLAKRAGAMQRYMRRLERVAGLMFIGFGVRLALTESPSP